MLYSIRPYIAPYNVQSTRPPTFRAGYQQDSFEYLGYLLDQLYEEEKKFIIAVETRRNQLNNSNGSLHSNNSINSGNGYVNNNSYNNNNNTNNSKNSSPINGFNNSSNNNNNINNNHNELSPDGTNSAASVSSLNHMDPNEDADSANGSQALSTSSMDVDTPTDDSLAVASPMDDRPNDLDNDEAPMIGEGIIIALPPPSTPIQSLEPTPPTTPKTQQSAELPKTPPIVVTNTLVQRIFTGTATITHKCLTCCTESKIVDHFNELQLAFPNHVDMMNDDNDYQTQQLLNDYFITEKLVDDNKYSCEKCKALCDGERKLNIVEGPANLILVIKHFKYDRKFHIRRKLMHKVHHNEWVTLNVTREKGDRWLYKYRLNAVIVHCGINIDSGHYFTFAADANRNWFKFNDSHVSGSSLNELMQSSKFNSPYILFYELMEKKRCDMTSLDMICGELANGTTIENNDHGHGYELPSGSLSPMSNGDNDSFTAPHTQAPPLSSLSLYLQDYVHNENRSYKNDLKRSNYGGRTDFLNFHNSNRRSDDRDRDPPSSCGGNGSNITSNQYLY